MKITQEMVDRIVKRAKASNLGLNESEKSNPYNIENYNPPDLNSLAMLLVNAHFDKSDIISIVAAALEIIEEEMQKHIPCAIEYSRKSYMFE